MLSAGQQLFAAQSADSVTIDDIVNKAEVAKGSFYNHFSDKQAFAHAIYELIQADLERRIAASNRGIGDAAQRIVRALCTVLGYGDDQSEKLRALITLSERRTSPSHPLNRGLTADIRAGLAQGQLRGVDLETGVLVSLGLIGVAVRHVTDNDTPTRPDSVARRIGAALLRALGVDGDQAERLSQAAALEILGGRAQQQES